LIKCISELSTSKHKRHGIPKCQTDRLYHVLTTTTAGDSGDTDEPAQDDSDDEHADFVVPGDGTISHPCCSSLWGGTDRPPLPPPSRTRRPGKRREQR
jgi:hypothetical protein